MSFASSARRWASRLVCGIWVLASTSACESPDPAPPDPAEDPSAQPTGSAPALPQDTVAGVPEILPDGIGAARAGMTLGEIRDALEAGLQVGELNDRFMVDLNVMPVFRGRDTLYYLVFPAEETPADTSVPVLALTNHPEVRTREGIGPGSTISEAAAEYGSPTLSYNVNDEMREYASFPGYRHPTVRFRVAPGESVLLAGRYADGGEHGRTVDYDGSAHIMMVMVALRHF